MIFPKRPSAFLLLLLTVISLSLLLRLYHSHNGITSSLQFPHHGDGDSDVQPSSAKRLHLVLPATNQDVNLCKTLLTASVLEYPTPHLIAWGQHFDNSAGLLGGGSHVAKITGVLEYLESLDSSLDDELVFMLDAYDIWFQLRPEVLLSRYHKINAEANERLRHRLGRAVDAEDLRQTIIFGSGKRCAPNQVHTVACYPIPESPLPPDVYGANTDTIMGRNKYTSLRQRWLNSGYVIGPVADMRRLFRRAQEKVDALKDHLDWDNGSGGSDFMYHGSDQSIFNTIWGEQEFQREVMRRRHRTKEDRDMGIAPDPAPTRIEGTTVDDPLDPSFTHEPYTAHDGKPDEFGIGVDYFSELGQQTANAEEDGMFIQRSEDLATRLSDRRGLFLCPPRATTELPADISNSSMPFEMLSSWPVPPAQPWMEVPLYTNVCLNTVPVMIHHNGNKDARNYQWPRLWIQPHAQAIMNSLRGDGSSQSRLSIVAYSGGATMSWDELCPAEMDKELFRAT